ncbi:MAG: endonuclease/exonuclease/phosphatase family protein, partial [Desulfuromonadales bacterium]|nr:endonuclease/exonuclease/phosphatase family protein [Desulfuromonadales bacterium]
MLGTVTRGFLLLLGGVVIVGTALPLLRATAWWVRIFDFPRVQLLFLGAAVLVLLLLSSRPLRPAGALFLLLLAGSLLYQGWRIYPYTIFAGQQVQGATRERPETTVRLLVANVLMDNRNDGDFRRLIAEEQPDLLLVVEPDHWWEERLRPLAADYPHVLRYPLDNTYGMLLYSRHPFTGQQIHFLIKDDIPSFQVQIRLPFGHRVDLWGLHPEPPTPQESDSSAPRDAELLLVGKTVQELGHPVIVAGDLNDVAWSHTTRLFQRISGLLDPRIGRGRFSTYHARFPFLRWPLDHVFHSDHFRLVELRVLPNFGSDHFPILAVLSLESEGRPEQGEPEPE